MHFKRLHPVFSFILLIFIFYFCGRAIVPLANALRFPVPAEVVFAKAEENTKPDFALFSALPLSIKAHSTEIALSKETTPLPSPVPLDTKYDTYVPEPATLGDSLQIKNSTSYTFDADALLAAPFPLQEGQPKVLILHTHTSEAYAPDEKYAYTPSDAYRTEDPDFNICRIGQALADSLESNGISTLHDTTSHDYPSYSGCYGRSLETIEKNLALYPTIDVVIDLHRDAISAPDGSYMKTAANIDGKTAAQALVVVGTDAGGLSHPNWQKNLSLGLKVQKTLCDMYPGLARPLHLRTERFNGHAAEGALLIEIGSNGNTMEEALYSAELVGQALSKTLLSLMP